MLKPGSKAPEFEGETSTGQTFRMGEHRGKRVVLFFFPKAFTPGCSVEVAAFRDHGAELARLGAEVVGISTDRLETQCSFARERGATFPLVADPDGRIASAYGVLWPFLPFARRVTFVVGPSGVVEKVIHREVMVAKHVEEVRAHLSSVDEADRPASEPAGASPRR